MPGIAFDFDMTLADTNNAVYRSLVSSFSKLSIPLVATPRDRFHSLRGLKLREQLIGMSFSPLSPNDLRALEQVFMEQYPVVGIQNTEAFPGITEIFTTLRNRNIPVHIVSAKHPKNLILSLQHLGFKPDAWIGGVAGKQKVEYLIHNKCSTYVGDAPIDVEIARSASCIAIIINNANEPVFDWPVQPDYLFTSSQNFLSWLSDPGNSEFF